jgi:transcriptional regulator with XRE-family HTH domain
VYRESLETILSMERFNRNLTQEQVCEALQMNMKTLRRIKNDNSVHGKTIKMLIVFMD